ncbi:MerR family transcriptional regulator [Oculatella sp. FACHB-28]|uniref:MerR family transcriptional regulator n=1 Tax=Oculatella sp. FACHB-28 TaxID=2692845 RepID=UPI00168555D2|nr:MerR family transcriptional regulator [Oculatella sp. FACHB-28]MBD2056033.1 MerR family transcriptional regulator [Oculatella sp. FACHB-28]
MEEKFFTSTEAAKITQCSRRQLQYWRERKVVVPTVNTTGKGRNVYYSVSDLWTLTLMQYLLSLGLSFEVCQSTLDFLRLVEPALFENPLSYKVKKRFMLWQSEEDERLRCVEFNEEKAITAIQNGQAIIPLWMETLGERLEKKLQVV